MGGISEERLVRARNFQQRKGRFYGSSFWDEQEFEEMYEGK